MASSRPATGLNVGSRPSSAASSRWIKDNNGDYDDDDDDVEDVNHVDQAWQRKGMGGE